ncbi:DUF1576 domain-containing protein [Tsukamurella sp. PLM1]|uniref:DUF1576 domain-containing protein n=1 Tax=Tsukamurella sp. PLM1 TaxID=2929795 RepID=UPI002045E591|nr:DUF1576 domain-containing protein [Tsukamurella sp. PLM1]BDH58471.1 hypothetical protein MTP03_34100 [Tsukamurella sp. PLM1]
MIAPAQRDRALLALIALTALGFVAFGLVMDAPAEVARGLRRILTAQDMLISDFTGVGGVGAAFVNAGVLTLLACLAYAVTGAKVDGAAVGCLYMLLGFALFGKSLLNVWPILIGVALYAIYRREPLRDYLTTAIFATALAPVGSEIAFNSALARPLSLPLGFAVGVLIGFVIPTVARQLFRAHNGFTLYNMGFVAGVLGAVVIAVCQSYGLAAPPPMQWTVGHDAALLILTGLVVASIVVAAFVFDPRPWRGLHALNRRTGQAPADFVASDGAGATLLNMAALGVVGTGFLLAIGADVTGPAVGGVLSMIGFGACGKHVLNAVPVMLGVVLAALVKSFGLTDPGVIWPLLFGTALAPLAGRFGWHWGLLAGFLHLSVAQVAGGLTAGLNLYGNGFAAGLVAAVLSAIALMFVDKRETDRQRDPLVTPLS